MTDEMISSKSPLFLRICCFLVLHPKIACVVPQDYCFHELNKSDCNVSPTPVFYYYKPGSRCELATWRGCPTYNKFENEYQCSNTCIYRLNLDFNENFSDYIPNTGDTKLSLSVDKYIKDVSADIDWEDEIKVIPTDDVAIIHNILDEVMNDSAVSPTINIETSKVLQTTSDVVITTANSETTEKRTTFKQEMKTKTESPKITETTTLSSLPTTASADPDLKTTSQNVVITTVNVVTTEPTTEAVTTILTTKISTTKGNPEEVIVMKK